MSNQITCEGAKGLCAVTNVVSARVVVLLLTLGASNMDV